MEIAAHPPQHVGSIKLFNSNVYQRGHLLSCQVLLIKICRQQSFSSRDCIIPFSTIPSFIYIEKNQWHHNVVPPGYYQLAFGNHGVMSNSNVGVKQHFECDMTTIIIDCPHYAMDVSCPEHCVVSKICGHCWLFCFFFKLPANCCFLLFSQSRVK